MSWVRKFAKASPSRTDATRHRSDNQFLPAALEILETPASPVKTALIWFICVLAAGALLWSYIGKFDIVATAQGKIQPAGRVKVIQSIETGKTTEVPVSNGVLVKAGDVLVHLDDTAVKAAVDAAAANLAALRGEVIRREASLGNVRAWIEGGLGKRKLSIQRDLLTFDTQIPKSVQQRELSNFSADLTQLLSSINNLNAQYEQKQSEIDSLSGTVTAQKSLVETLAERVTMRSSLVASNAGTRASVIDAMESRQKEHAELTVYEGQLAEAKSALKVVDTEVAKVVDAFVAENVQHQSDAARQIDELEQELIKARTRHQSMVIRSPIDGVVQASAITTVGQVVSAGSELMRVVPRDSPLEIEAYLPNHDVGFVSAGQPAIIKVEAFPFTRYGVINGHVTRIATDAIPEPDAQQLEGAAAKELQSAVPIGNVQRMQNLVFPITIQPNDNAFEVDGKMLHLSAGMSVTVEVKTGQRRILEYIFSPLAEISSEAMQER